MKRKLIALLVVIVLSAALQACGGGGAGDAQQQPTATPVVSCYDKGQASGVTNPSVKVAQDGSCWILLGILGDSSEVWKPLD